MAYSGKGLNIRLGFRELMQGEHQTQKPDSEARGRKDHGSRSPSEQKSRTRPAICTNMEPVNLPRCLRLEEYQFTFES